MKTILITGASSGFGRATAEALGAQGHRLILLARRADRLEALKKSLDNPVHIAVADVTNREQVAACFADLPEEFKQIDVLINNAGLALGMAPAPECSLEDWEQMVETNIKGLLRVTRPVLDIMKAQGHGLIINLGSMAANVPYRGGNVYGATKAFVKQFSRNLRADLYDLGIKVTNIEPAAAETEFSVVRFKDRQKADDFYKGWKPLLPEDIARTIAWVVGQPPHVNIDNIEIMPVAQSYGGLVIHKN